jgi:hypothetical protein
VPQVTPAPLEQLNLWVCVVGFSQKEEKELGQIMAALDCVGILVLFSFFRRRHRFTQRLAMLVGFFFSFDLNMLKATVRA